MQLDIFEHSRDVMLRNDVLDALGRRDAAAASVALRALVAEFPGDDGAGALAELIRAIEPRDAPPFADHAAAERARDDLVARIEPAAARALGAAAAAWLTPLRRDLARRAARLPFAPPHAEVHAAALWLRAGDYAGAADAASTIESWRRIPAPLAWMAEARLRITARTPRGRCSPNWRGSLRRALPTSPSGWPTRRSPGCSSALARISGARAT